MLTCSSAAERLLESSYPSERHHVEGVLSAVDGVQEVAVGDLRPGKHLQLTADTRQKFEVIKIRGKPQSETWLTSISGSPNVSKLFSSVQMFQCHSSQPETLMTQRADEEQNTT